MFLTYKNRIRSHIQLCLVLWPNLSTIEIIKYSMFYFWMVFGSSIFQFDHNNESEKKTQRCFVNSYFLQRLPLGYYDLLNQFRSFVIFYALLFSCIVSQKSGILQMKLFTSRIMFIRSKLFRITKSNKEEFILKE